MGVRPSQPIHVGAWCRSEERERLQTSYNNFHNFKLVMHDRRKGDDAGHHFCIYPIFYTKITLAKHDYLICYSFHISIDISSKPSSYRLLAGTNEFAEDLTGQRMPLNASQWKSETGVSNKK